MSLGLKKKLFWPVLALLGITPIAFTKAVCPVCTIAVGSCVGLARWLKIDDRITGLWVGGLIVSLIIWTIDYLNKKNIRFKARKILIAFGYYLLTVLPLYFTGVMGHPLNKCWGVDRLLFGIVLGSLVFWTASFLNDFLKKKNNNKSYFPLQKVAFPVVFLAITSLVIYLIIR